MIIPELFAIAVASIAAAWIGWYGARRRRRRREIEMQGTYEEARQRWIMTGSLDAYDEMLRLTKGDS